MKIDPCLLSAEVRNQDSVRILTESSVFLANLAAELSKHLSEKEFAEVRERIVDTVNFFGNVLPAVTPIKEEVKEEPIEEPIIDKGPTPAVKALNPAVARALGNLDTKTRKAVGRLVPQQDQVPPETVFESSFLRAAAADPLLVPVNVKLDIKEHKEEVEKFTMEDPSNYERALVLVELWSKDVKDV